MSFTQLLLLGAIAGLTIFLGLPVAVIRGVKSSTKGVLNAFATGIILFLGIEIVAKVLELGEHAVEGLAAGELAAGPAIGLLLLIAAGITAGLLGIPLIERYIIKPAAKRASERHTEDAGAPVPSANGNGGGTATATAAPAHVAPTASMKALSLSIAAGIGLHNFGEGLAIGQSAASGAISLAILLVIGFGLHNMTEGFGIAAPLAGERPTAGFLLGAGLIAGGPTFLGTVVGSAWTSEIATAIFLSVAGGSLVYVTTELFFLGRSKLAKVPLMAAIVSGFMVGYLTEIVVALAMG